MLNRIYCGMMIAGLILGFMFATSMMSSTTSLAAQPNSQGAQIVQPEGTAAPLTEQGQEYTSPLSIDALPDLIILSITLIPANPGAGGTADIEVVVKNQGNAATSAIFNLYLYVEPTTVPPVQGTPYTTFASYALPLSPGGTFKYTRTGQQFINSPPVVFAWVDPSWDNRVVESDEDNNLFPSVTSAPDAYEDDDTCPNAKEVIPDGAIQERNLYRDPESDIDWIKFSGVSGVTYQAEAIAVGADANLTIGLYDRCDGAFSFGNGAKMEFTAPVTGNYIVKVFSSVANYGPDNDYQFKVTSDSGCTNYYEPNNACSQSGDLPLETTQTHTSCSAGDADWMQLAVTAGTKYKVTSANVGSKADAELKLFINCTQETETSKGQTINFTAAESGQVYIQAAQKEATNQGPGTDYTVKAELVGAAGCSEDSFEQDDTRAEAKTIDTDGTVQVHNTCPAADGDWVKFSVFSGRTYNVETINLASSADTEICLHNSNGDELMCDDDKGEGKGSRLLFEPPVTGEYFLHIQDVSTEAAGAETQYTLRIREGICVTDTFEGDSSRDEAKMILADNTTSTHNFCPGGDQDWMAFYATGGTAYVINTLNLGAEADTIIRLYDNAGNLVVQNDDYTPGTGSQAAFIAPASGTYFIDVIQYNPSNFGAGTDYGIRVRVGTPTPTPAVTVTATPTATATPSPSEVRTLILVNRSRLVDLYSESETAAVMSKLSTLVQHPQVRGEIIQLENNTEVQTAYSIWAGDQGNIAKANQVTSMIRSLVMTYLQQRTGIEYLVLVGDDRALPMRRVLDYTPISSESSYKHTDVNNPTGAAIKGNYYLTDDYFSDRETTLQGNRELYIPDLATGRLIETPSEIIAQIDAFLADPLTNPAKILVTGYDFVQDVAAEDCTDWGSEFGETNANCSLIGAAWTGTAFRSLQLNATPPFLIQSISGHAAHYVEGAASGTAIQAQEIADATINLSGGLIYSVGCHGGLNVPPNNPVSAMDLPQAFIGKGANYVGNTGYGWGMRNSIGLTERLIRLFTRALLAGTKSSMGKSLATAKVLYYTEDHDFSSYDEKVMQQVVFYGLPMYELETAAVLDDPGNDFPGVGFTPELPGGELGDTQVITGSIGIDFSQAQNLVLSETGDGNYFALNGSVHTVPGQPMQPLHFGDVSVPKLPARGVLLEGAVLESQGPFDPIIVNPYNEFTIDEIEPELRDPLGIYPAAPLSIQEHNGVSSLVTQMGQYDAAQNKLFLMKNVQAELYYSTSLDTLPPISTVIDGVTASGSKRVSIKVGAVDGSGIERIVLSYIIDVNETVRQLRSINLSYDNASHKWVGAFDGDINSRFLVQIVDNAGNITTATNKGRYYQPGVVTESTGISVYLPLVRR